MKSRQTAKARKAAEAAKAKKAAQARKILTVGVGIGLLFVGMGLGVSVRTAFADNTCGGSVEAMEDYLSESQGGQGDVTVLQTAQEGRVRAVLYEREDLGLCAAVFQRHLLGLRWADDGMMESAPETGLSLTAPRDIPILIGMGYGVAALEEIPWLADTRILYFGDLDTHGLAILAECRKRFPQTESLLMDQATFDRFRPLAVTEARQAGPLPEALNESEAALYAELLRTQGRLEQERIPLEVVNAAISLALERT